MKNRPGLLPLLLLAGVFFAALFTLTVVFRNELSEGVVRPLQVWLRSVNQNWLSMDSGFRWSVFIIVLGAILFLSFPAPQRHWERSSRKTVEKTAGRLAFWRAELKILLGRGSINRFTIFELRRLALDVVGFRQQLPPEEAEEWLQAHLEAEKGDVPAAIRFLVDNDALVSPASRSAPVSNLRDFLRMLLQPVPLPQPRLITDEQVEVMILYLEDILEVSNEDHHNS